MLYIHVIIYTAEKATEILREVKGAQEAFRKQKDLQKLEAEVHTYNMIRALLNFHLHVSLVPICTCVSLCGGSKHTIVLNCIATSSAFKDSPSYLVKIKLHAHKNASSQEHL